MPGLGGTSVFVQLLSSLAKPPPKARRCVPSDDLRLLALEVWTKRACPCCHVRRGLRQKAQVKRAQVQGAGFRLGLPPKNLALSPAAEMRRNFRRLRLHEPGPQNRVGQETMDPCQSLFEPLKPLSNVGLPNASLASPLPPLPSLTVVKNLPPDVTVDGPFEAHINLFVTAKVTGIIGTTTTRDPTRRHEFLPRLLV